MPGGESGPVAGDLGWGGLELPGMPEWADFPERGEGGVSVCEKG